MAMSAVLSTGIRLYCCSKHTTTIHRQKTREISSRLLVWKGTAQLRIRSTRRDLTHRRRRNLEIRQVRVRDSANGNKAVIYTGSKSSNGWITINPQPSFTKQQQQQHDDDVSRGGSNHWIVNSIQEKVIPHFLPAHYPVSVAQGYGRFAALGFGASVAGSAAMVLSTQTLLLAVGVVGASSPVHHASIMAGALNWVLKDGIGQLGGVLFASRMSASAKAFDSDPKRWRMVAALSMDGATLLEILSPLVPSMWVLPIASVANIAKNIGFLTASASRAALHQSLAVSNNLADVTAKAGSQALAASLVGTGLGIGLSPILLGDDVVHFTLAFLCLSVVHEGCNYLSCKAVPLSHLNRQRLVILVQEYVKTNIILSPTQVAEKESFLPLYSRDDSKEWLCIGSPLPVVCPRGPEELERLLLLKSSSDDEQSKYVMNVVDTKIHLVFFQGATGETLITGVLQAHLVHNQLVGTNPVVMDDDAVLLSSSYEMVNAKANALLDGMKKKGWKTGTEFTSIESSKACRFNIVES